MITKRDWRKFVQKVYKLDNTLNLSYAKDCRVHFTLMGERIFQVDIDNDRILCVMNTEDPMSHPTYREYKHPDSFSNYVSLDRIKNGFRLELVANNLDYIERFIKTR